MNKKYKVPESDSQMVSEPAVVVAAKPAPLHLDIQLEDNAMVADIKKAIKMIKGIASVRVVKGKHSNSEAFVADNIITPALAKKIEKARQDYVEGRYTECRTEADLEAFLDAL